jgi:hypothetical protein
MSEPDRLEVEFEHRNGWQQGQVSLPSGLRDRVEIVDGTFTVEFTTTESLISNPTFARLIEAGHSPVGGVPDDEQQAVQQRLGSPDATDDTSSEPDGDSGDADADSGDDSEPDALDDMERSELYERAHKLDAVPDDEIPEWNDSTAPGLRELIREHTE